MTCQSPVSGQRDYDFLSVWFADHTGEHFYDGLRSNVADPDDLPYLLAYQ